MNIGKMRNGGESAGQGPEKIGLKSVSRKDDSVPGLPAEAARNLTSNATVNRKFMPISTRKKRATQGQPYFVADKFGRLLR
ncbi:MAG: hypothetical protein JNJ95_02540 [Dechloromonas sp.]|nr:hypothetical protein [Dechloromonas sp.]